MIDERVVGTAIMTAPGSKHLAIEIDR